MVGRAVATPATAVAGIADGATVVNSRAARAPPHGGFAAA
jgi:hypothetical protein